MIDHGPHVIGNTSIKSSVKVGGCQTVINRMSIAQAREVIGFRGELVSGAQPPREVDYTPRGLPSLELIYKNDEVGDCVIAGAHHIVSSASLNAGLDVVSTDANVLDDYIKIAGYVPGDPSTDRGCVISSALGYFHRNGFASGAKLEGYLRLDPSNVEEIKRALWIFENVLFGQGLPSEWLDPWPAGHGFVWGADGIPVPRNGHAYCGTGYNDDGVRICTWGLVGLKTWDAITELYPEIWVLLTSSVLDKLQRSASGFDWPTLKAQWVAMGGVL